MAIAACLHQPAEMLWGGWLVGSRDGSRGAVAVALLGSWGWLSASW